MLLARIAALVLPAFAFAADAATDGHDEDLRQLTADTFTDSVAHGAWLVEHYSPRCAHCRAFAPTWGRLAKDLKYLENLAGFHMAQVNCLAQGDLCTDNNVKAYPQIDLYIDGKYISEYNSDRNEDFVRKWIEDEAVKYARTIVLGSEDDDATTESAAVNRPNRNGTVVEVDAVALNKYKQEGPVFVDFYAPWCTHCKALRPTLDKLAGQLKGKMNIVAVNCDAYGNVCKDNGIKGYPTLRLFAPNGAGGFNETDYMQSRKLEAISDFLKPAMTEPKMQPMNLDDLDAIVQSEDVFLLYLQNFGTTLEDLKHVERSVKPLLGQVPIYTANDPLLYANLSIAHPIPSSLLLAFAGGSVKPVTTLALPAKDNEEVPKFLNKNRYPLVTTLTKETYTSVMESEEQPLIVLGAVHSDDQRKAEVEIMEAMSRAFRRGGRSQYRPVRFVVADDSLHTALQRMFKIRPADLPSFVVVDPSKEVYYEAGFEGKRAAFTGEAAFEVLEGVWQGRIAPIPIRSAAWAHQTMMGMGSWSSEHPLLATLSTLGFIGVVVYFGLKCLRRDIKSSYKGGYMNEKGFAYPKAGHRLD